jgi:cell division protein FtsB
MVEFNRKKTYKKYIYSPFALLSLLFVFLVLLKALWGVYAKERRSAAYLEREQGEYSRVMDRKKELAQAVDFLKTDQGVEAEIRSKFRVVKEGEEVAVIIGDEATTTSVQATTTPPGFFKRIFGIFGF